MVERLLSIIKQKGLSVNAVEKQLGFGNGAIKRFSTSSPSVDKIIALSNFLNVTVEYILFGNENVSELSDDIKNLVTYYKTLSDKDKGMVLGKAETLAELAAERAAEQAKKTAKPIELVADRQPEEELDQIEEFYIDLCSLPASAGSGVQLDEGFTEPMQIKPTAIAKRANYAIRVSGDSMETEYSDGDIVLVETCPDVAIGEIGIFVVNDQGYIKKRGEDRLISLNPDSPDVTIHEGDVVYCRGRVLGKAEIIK